MMSEAIETYDSLQDHLISKVDDVDAQALFIEGGVDTILAYVQDQIDWEGIKKADLEKEVGRKEIKSTSYAIARVKTALDDKGKAFIADKKAECKKVDVVRKRVRDFCEDLQAQVKEGLTAREEAIKAEVEAKRIAREEEQRLKDEKLERLMAAETARQEDEARKAREAEIAREAEERARQQAQEDLERAEREKAEAQRREQEATKRAERERQEAKERAEREKVEAAERARQEERDRLAQEEAMAEMAREQEEEDRLAMEQDEDNRQWVYYEIREDLERVGADHRVITNILDALDMGGIRHVSINFSSHS